MASGAPRRASQRMVIHSGTIQWDEFVRAVRERLSLPLAAYPALTLLDPHGTEIASLGRLPRRDGGVITVLATMMAPAAPHGVLAQLQAAVGSIYEVCVYVCVACLANPIPKHTISNLIPCIFPRRVASGPPKKPPPDGWRRERGR